MKGSKKRNKSALIRSLTECLHLLILAMNLGCISVMSGTGIPTRCLIRSSSSLSSSFFLPLLRPSLFLPALLSFAPPVVPHPLLLLRRLDTKTRAARWPRPTSEAASLLKSHSREKQLRLPALRLPGIASSLESEICFEMASLLREEEDGGGEI